MTMRVTAGQTLNNRPFTILRYRESDFGAFSPLEFRGNYSATLNNMKLHWPLMGGLLHLVQRGGEWAGPHPARPLLAVPKVSAHPSTASVPITARRISV